MDGIRTEQGNEVNLITQQLGATQSEVIYAEQVYEILSQITC